MSKDIELFDPDAFALKSRSDGYIPFLPDVEIISREEWGAVPPRALEEAQGGTVGNIVATLNTGTRLCVSQWECEQIVREIQGRHLKLGYSDIQYNFLIGCDGRVYEGRGWYGKSCPQLETPKRIVIERGRLDIAFIGDWRYSQDPATEMLDPSILLVLFGVKKGFIAQRYNFFELDKRYAGTENGPGE